MDRALKDIERVAGQDVYWHYGQAVRLTWMAEDKKKSKAAVDQMLNDALKHITAARDLHPSWSRLAVLMGVIYAEQGKMDWALNKYLEAIELGERSPQIIQRTLQLLFEKQRFTQADDLLQKLEKQQVSFTSDLNWVTAQVALHQKEFGRALETARKAAAGSKKYQDYLWLGQMLIVVGNQAKADGQAKQAQELLAEAEQTLRRATEIAPTVAVNWVALVQLYGATEAKDKAEKAIREASQKISVKEAPLALAQCYESMRNMDAAQKQYEAVLAAAPKDPVGVRSRGRVLRSRKEVEPCRSPTEPDYRRQGAVTGGRRILGPARTRLDPRQPRRLPELPKIAAVDR